MINAHLSLVSPDTQNLVDGDTVDDQTILSFWESWAAASGHRPRTIKTHLINLRALLRRTDKTILSMTRYDLIQDLGRPGIASSTRQHLKSLMHGFWTWVQDEGFRIDCPAARLPSVRVVKAEPNPITTADLEVLISSGIYSRTRMYVLLYAYQGFRASEIAAVAGESIDWARRRILSVEGKGGKEVWRPIHPLIWDEAQKYPRMGYWFPSPYTDGHITGKNVSTVLSQAMKRAGIVGHRPHNLRGWYATQLSAGGAPTAVVAAGLRHSDMQSVNRYLAVSQEAIAAAQATLPVIEVPQHSARRRAA